MNDNLRAYEQQQFAKHHYRKLIAAKSTIKHFKPQNRQLNYSASRTLTPLDRYEYTLANDKIRNKLSEIYQQSAARIKAKKKKEKQCLKSTNFQNKEKQKTMDSQNIKMFQRIVAAKSTICDMKERERSLRKYSKMTRKNRPCPDQNLFQAFRQILVQTRMKPTRSTRNSSVSKKSGRRRRPQSGKCDIKDTL